MREKSVGERKRDLCNDRKKLVAGKEETWLVKSERQRVWEEKKVETWIMRER